jgi:hypothetical protein
MVKAREARSRVIPWSFAYGTIWIAIIMLAKPKRPHVSASSHKRRSARTSRNGVPPAGDRRVVAVPGGVMARAALSEGGAFMKKLAGTATSHTSPPRER